MSVVPLDPVAPDERVAVVEALLSTCRSLQSMFPDVDLSDEVERCEAALEEARQKKQRVEWLEQENRRALDE